MGEKHKITIYDLAQKLGTTASTVSRALQNNVRISSKMRKAVQDLAAELNYIPDPVAHHLRTGKGNTLGIVVPRIDRNFFSSIISIFQKTAQAKGYNIIIAASNENLDDERAAVNALLSKKVDGIAMSLSTASKGIGYDEICKAHNTPIIYFDRLPKNFTTDTVSNDNYQIGYDAASQLIKIGKKRFAHFAGPQDLPEYRDRQAGFLQCLKDNDIIISENFIFENCITLEKGAETAQKIISAEDRPDAIFSSGDYPAITAMDTFSKNGFSMPHDISIIGVANEPLDAYLNTPLSSFDLNEKRIGEIAANILINKIESKETENVVQHIVVKHELKIRQSAQ